MAGLDPAIRDVARHFVLTRQSTMRGIDLDTFDFDYDLTWMAFILDHKGHILGRYGGRDATSAESQSSLAGLRYALERALERHKAGKAIAPRRAEKLHTVADYPALSRLTAKACVHCHHVHDFRREALQTAKKFTPDRLWNWPLPDNLGFTLDVTQGDRLKRVQPGSVADKAGLRAGDRLLTLDGHAIASFAEVQYALHRANPTGALAVRYERDGKPAAVELPLALGWGKTDLSWRWSLRGLEPAPRVQGEDLTAQEKKTLGLAPDRLALRQSAFVNETARQAGIRAGDIILGVDGKLLSMSARQFQAHVRLTYQVGDQVTYEILRDGERRKVTLTLGR